jgi:RND superfamily putative drug exporter
VLVKLTGTGLAVAVLMDAGLVRGVLVPAFMRLAGGANWWAPASWRGRGAGWRMSSPPPAPKESST